MTRRKKPDVNSQGSSILKNNLPVIILSVFAFLLYFNTIKHDYVLDDRMVITHNVFTEKGIKGIKEIITHDTFYGNLGNSSRYVSGGRYRPFSLITFAIEKELFGSNPHISHFINILLYILLSYILYRILLMIFETKQPDVLYSIPFITTLIFIAHPVHTEVVANIKSRDEILSLLFAMISLRYLFRFVKSNSTLHLVFAGLSFFIALLSKESVVSFIFIIPLSIYFFRKTPFRKILITCIPLVIAVALVVIIRLLILPVGEPVKELLNNPFLDASLIQKYATISYILGKYLILLLFPYELTYDYYPYHISLISFSDIRAILPALINVALFIYAVINIKKKSIYSYSILFYLLSLFLITNILFPVGVFMAERFLFVPSLAFCLIVAYTILKLNRRTSLILLSLVLLFYSVRTITRNSVWKDNYTLLTTDVQTSSGSAFSNCAAADYIMIKASNTNDIAEKGELVNTAIHHLRKSIAIHPKYERAYAILSEIYTRYKINTDSSIYFYKRLFDLNPTWPNCAYNIGTIYLEMPEKNVDESIYYLKKAISIYPAHYGAVKNLGAAYFYKGEFRKSAETFEKAYKMQPSDITNLNNIIIAYTNAGDTTKAAYYKSREVKK